MAGIWDRDYARREEWCGAHPPNCNCADCVAWREKRLVGEYKPYTAQETVDIELFGKEWVDRKRQKKREMARREREKSEEEGIEYLRELQGPRCSVCGKPIEEGEGDRCEECASGGMEEIKIEEIPGAVEMEELPPLPLRAGRVRKKGRRESGIIGILGDIRDKEK
ncbi:MAG: hypothetical protein MUO24_04760 [Desulfobacterales bacterium]|nr:hypothetical protein [Desulfobacterales bacterium]